MSETLDKITFEDIIKRILKKKLEEHIDRFAEDAELVEEYAPYGDTFACSGRYLSERDEARATAEFKDNFEISDIEEELLNDTDFIEKVKEEVLKL